MERRAMARIAKFEDLALAIARGLGKSKESCRNKVSGKSITAHNLIAILS